MNPLRLSYLYLKRHLFTTVVTVAALSIAIAAVTVLLQPEVLSHSRFDTLAPQGDAIVGAKSGGIDILLGALNFEGEIPSYLPQNLFETLKAKKDIQFEDWEALILKVINDTEKQYFIGLKKRLKNY